MKSLSDYTRDPISALFASCGAFFAFNKEQLDAKSVPGLSYCGHGSGAVVPVEKARELSEGLLRITKEGVAQDLAENGKEGVIRRTLFDEECFYTGDISGVANRLECYGISFHEVFELYQYIRCNEDVDL